MWPVPESQTVYDGMARRPRDFALRAACDWRFTSLLDVVAYISCRARGHVKLKARPARVHRYEIRYIFSARGTPVLRFRPGTSISRTRTRVTRLVSVAFSVAFPCGVSPARRRGRGHIVNSSWRLPRPASRPTPGPRLGSAVHNCDSDLLCAASRMPLRIPCVLVRSRSLLARFFHTCRHTWLKASPPTLAPPRSPSRILISYCGSLLHTLSVAGAARSSSTGPILD